MQFFSDGLGDRLLLMGFRNKVPTYFNTSAASHHNNSGRTEIKKSETNTINSSNEKGEELKPLIVYDMAAKDSITEADTSKDVQKEGEPE